MLEFFGLKRYADGEYHYIREAEGAWSWQHLLFVSLLIALMIGLAVYIGLKLRKKPYEVKNKVLVWCAFLIDGFEIV